MFVSYPWWTVCRRVGPELRLPIWLWCQQPFGSRGQEYPARQANANFIVCGGHHGYTDTPPIPTLPRHAEYATVTHLIGKPMPSRQWHSLPNFGVATPGPNWPLFWSVLFENIAQHQQRHGLNTHPYSQPLRMNFLKDCF